MTWLKLDDGMYTNPKVHGLGHHAFRVHIGALLHCAKELTDGVVSIPALYSLTVPGMRKMESYAAELVAAGLWFAAGDGWEIKDYLEYNPARKEVLERRRKEAERKAGQRAR